MHINYSLSTKRFFFFFSLFIFRTNKQKWWTTDETVVSNSNNNNANLTNNGTQFKQNKLLATQTPYITGVNNGGNDTYERMELQTPSMPFILTNEDAYGIEDFIHLPGPLTEDAVVRVLHTRFKKNKHFVRRIRNILNEFPITHVNFFFRQISVPFFWPLIRTQM